MNPAARLSAALVAGLVLTLPAIDGSMHGDVDLASTAVRFLAAFMLSWAAFAAVARLVETYASAPPPQAAPVEDHPRRRADDAPTTAGAQ